jgi:hypothetical protein
MIVKILGTTRYRWAIVVLSVVIAIWLCNFLRNTWIERTTFDCNQPPAGVIRFTLSSGQNDGRLYEWKGRTFRQIGTTPIGKEMVGPYAKESYYNPTIWGAEVQGINRQAVGAGSFLSTPYAISPDHKWLVAALGPEFNYSDGIAFLSPDTSKIFGTVNFHEAINAMAWDPLSQLVVVVSHSESYGVNPLSLFGALFGHPIPYSNVTLKVIEPSGATRCTIHPARGLPFAGGYVRWDKQ